MFVPLREVITPTAARMVNETVVRPDGTKDCFMSGIFIQGDVRNQNERIYPVSEISNAVSAIKQRLSEGYTVLGEADHPDDLNINLDRVSHMIVDINMNDKDGVGKLKLLPTPLGNICRVMIENEVKLGVSSRGSGEVDYAGRVSGYQIITVDIVANPSAPSAYPTPIFEQLMNHRRGASIWDVATASLHDPVATKHLHKEAMSFINNLGRK